MYYDQYQPYYKAYSDPAFDALEIIQEREWEQMTSYYSAEAGRILQAVREQCRRLDFDGGAIYDEYPDPDFLRRLAEEIREMVGKGTDEELRERSRSETILPGPWLSAQARQDDFLDDLIKVLLLQEISRRRCRNQRCRHHERQRPNRR